MLNTYKAVLKGDRLEWLHDIPQELAQKEAVAVYVTVLEETSESANAPSGAKMAEALEKLAALGTLTRIADPVAWQREQRQDRVLPGRTP
jgi:hypothetical protein